jgi:hypothetical protein
VALVFRAWRRAVSSFSHWLPARSRLRPRRRTRTGRLRTPFCTLASGSRSQCRRGGTSREGGSRHASTRASASPSPVAAAWSCCKNGSMRLQVTSRPGRRASSCPAPRARLNAALPCRAPAGPCGSGRAAAVSTCTSTSAGAGRGRKRSRFSTASASSHRACSRRTELATSRLTLSLGQALAYDYRGDRSGRRRVEGRWNRAAKLRL